MPKIIPNVEIFEQAGSGQKTNTINPDGKGCGNSQQFFKQVESAHCSILEKPISKFLSRFFLAVTGSVDMSHPSYWTIWATLITHVIEVLLAIG